MKPLESSDYKKDLLKANRDNREKELLTTSSEHKAIYAELDELDKRKGS